MTFGANAVCGSQRAQGWRTERSRLASQRRFPGNASIPGRPDESSCPVASPGHRGAGQQRQRSELAHPSCPASCPGQDPPAVSLGASSGSSETRQPRGEQGRRRAASRGGSSTWDAGDWHQGQAPRCVPGQHLEDRELSKTCLQTGRQLQLAGGSKQLRGERCVSYKVHPGLHC